MLKMLVLGTNFLNLTAVIIFMFYMKETSTFIFDLNKQTSY